MGVVTRRALRVYVALSELKPDSGGDVMDALVPFFEPILEKMHGTIFVPRLLAVGAQRLYRWRINQDIAEHFIPKFVKRGFLKRHGRGGIYTVDFPAQPEPNLAGISDVVRKIIDEFEKFPPRVTDLLNYNKTRDQLTDILIRFVVSLDAYGEAAFVAEVNRLAIEEQAILNNLEEGEGELPSDDKYMCARFVRTMCRERPEFVPHFARLASIGLLTEVVEDFVKPVKQEKSTNLALVLDGPVALDYLGCSGPQFQQDVGTVVDALRGIGCSVVVYPKTIYEMQDNLQTMLKRPKEKRNGYTHEAMARSEVMEDFVIAVARDPEVALERVRVSVKPIELDQFPNQHVYFGAEQYEDFLAQVTWGNDVAAKEHDATGVALTMRLREGKHSSDVLKCRYVFVTRNQTFERRSRDYCIREQLIYPMQQGPVIHLRELATIAWLRTGLGPSLDIPKAHLLAACDRVLRFNTDVQEAVAAKLREVTPEKFSQFEFLIQDQRSLQKLADETLNDERVVTTDNAPQLLEAMRAATIEEEKAAFDAKIKQQRDRFTKRQRADSEVIAETQGQLSEVSAALAAAESRESAAIDGLVERTNMTLKLIERCILLVLLALGLLAIYDYATGTLKEYVAWRVVLGAAGLMGLYHLIAHTMQKHVYGISNLLHAIGPPVFERMLNTAGLSGRFDVNTQAEFRNGQMVRGPKLVPPDPKPHRLV